MLVQYVAKNVVTDRKGGEFPIILLCDFGDQLESIHIVRGRAKH